MGLLLARHAENGGENAQRVCGGDIVCELALALAATGALDQRVHQRAGAFLDDRCDAFDGPRREPGRGNLAIVAMLRRIHPNDDAHLANSLVRFNDLFLRRTIERDAETAEEALGLLRDLANLVVANNGIEGVESVGLAMVQPIQLSQLAPLIVGDAALAVSLGRDQVESIDVGHQYYS